MSHPNINARNLLGENGGIFINDTAPRTGDWLGMQCVADCTFTTLTGNISGPASSITLAAGTTIFGHFTAITLATGSVVAYNRKG